MIKLNIFMVLVLVAGLLSGCREPGPGSVSGQIKAATPEGGARNIAGAQVILRGAQNTYTTVSNEGEESGDQADASYNYRFDNVPPGTYTMAVTPPEGAGLQPEDNITLEVKAGEMYPQSVLLLREGMARPRPLAPSEMNPGEAGYINERGERVVYQQGSGLDMTDLLLMYLIFRNPPGFGFGAPPVVINNPSPTGGGPRYQTRDPPPTSRTGQRVTQRPPSVPGQGATRPGAAPATGSGPSTSRPSTNGSSPNGKADVPSSSQPSGASKNGSSPDGSSSAKPGGSSGAPSQGVTRPSSSRPSAPAPSRSGGSRSGGGRR